MLKVGGDVSRAYGQTGHLVFGLDGSGDAAPLSQDDGKTDALKAKWTTSNPQHAIVNGGGGYPADSNGVPWSGAFITASGNLYADFMLNATVEMHGRLQVERLFRMTDDTGVRNLIRLLVTRDHMHQMQWLATLADGLDSAPVPEAFPLDKHALDFTTSSPGSTYHQCRVAVSIGWRVIGNDRCDPFRVGGAGSLCVAAGWGRVRSVLFAGTPKRLRDNELFGVAAARPCTTAWRPRCSAAGSRHDPAPAGGADQRLGAA